MLCPEGPYVKVNVICAKELAAADTNGKSDPFVKLSLVNCVTKKSSVVFKTQTVKMTLSPSWNESFVFPLGKDENIQQLRLVLQVFDWDSFGKDDELGEVVMDLDTHLDSQGLIQFKKDQQLCKPAGATANVFDKIMGGNQVAVKGCLEFSFCVVSQEFIELSKKFQFGCRLKDPVLKTQAVSGYETPIPTVLVLLKQAMKTHNAFNTPGIFTSSVQAEKLEKLKRQLDLFPGQFDLSKATDDPHLLAALLKNWFKSCPDRVLDLIDLSRVSQTDSDEVISVKLSTIPEPQKSLFFWLTDTVVEAVHTPKDAVLMGVALSQNLFHVDETADAKTAVEHAKVGNQFFGRCMQYRIKSAVTRAQTAAKEAKDEESKAVGRVSILSERLKVAEAALSKAQADHVSAAATLEARTAVVKETEAAVEAVKVKVAACM